MQSKFHELTGIIQWWCKSDIYEHIQCCTKRSIKINQILTKETIAEFNPVECHWKERWCCVLSEP